MLLFFFKQEGLGAFRFFFKQHVAMPIRVTGCHVGRFLNEDLALVAQQTAGFTRQSAIETWSDRSCPYLSYLGFNLHVLCKSFSIFLKSGHTAVILPVFFMPTTYQ